MPDYNDYICTHNYSVVVEKGNAETRTPARFEKRYCTAPALPGEWFCKKCLDTRFAGRCCTPKKEE